MHLGVLGPLKLKWDKERIKKQCKLHNEVTKWAISSTISKSETKPIQIWFKMDSKKLKCFPLWCHFKREVWIRSTLTVVNFQAQPRSCNISVTICIQKAAASLPLRFHVDEIFSQPSMSVISPSNASYTNRSKANILKTPVTASRCVVDTHWFFCCGFLLAFLHVLYVSYKLNLLMLSSRLS